MGDRGPIPKRSEDRERRNEPEGGPIRKGLGRWDFEIPEPPVKDDGEPAWHPIAVMVYESLKESGESDWFQLSDWAMAYLICEDITRELNPQFVGMGQVFNYDADEMETRPIKMRIPIKGASLGSILKALGELGMTEGSRRRMGIELQRAGEAGATPATPGGSRVVDARERFERGAKLSG